MAYNRTLGYLRLLALYLLVAVLLILGRPTVASVAAGAVLIALGEAVRLWAAGHLLKTAELVTSGPYRYTRNPLYLGRLFIFTGLAVAVDLPYHGSWIAIAVGWVLFFGYYLRRKERVEPNRLREVHGAPYERYFRAVPALWPKLSPYPEAAQRPWSLRRMVRNREHWMVVGLTVVVVFLLWRAGRFAG